MTTKPINVLRVITWLPVGGIERKIIAVLPRLDRARFNTRLVCLRERGVLAGELQAAGIAVDLVAMRSRLSPAGIYRLAQYMKQHRIDLVHAHMYRSNVPATIAARLAGIPIVITQVHNVDTWESGRQLWMDRQLCRWRTKILGVSERVCQDVIKNLQVPENKVQVLYNGVDVSRFSDRSKREATRQELGLAEGRSVLIYHGRLVKQKNPDVLIKIAAAVARPRDAILLVVGDGPCRDDMENQARDADLLSNNIRFLGRRDDIPDLLAAADFAISPSFKEGFSNSLIESLAAGLPTVATDVGGNAEAIKHRKSGIIVPARDDDTLLAAVGKLLDTSTQGLTAMRIAAMKRAELFSLDRMVQNVQNLYESLSDSEK